MNQNELRKQVKLAKVMNEEYTYKDFAEAIDLTEGSFYNWLNGAYNLSQAKYSYLQDIVINLID